MRARRCRNFAFTGYALPFDPLALADTERLRRQHGYRDDEKLMIAAVGGTAVGLPLLKRIADAFPAPNESDGFLTAVRALVDDGTTIILGRATPPGAGTATDALHVDLTTLAPASEPDAVVVLEGTR